MECPENVDVNRNIFNSDVFLHIREQLLNGELSESCMHCNHPLNSGATANVVNTIIGYINRIENNEQKNRVLISFNAMMTAIINRDSFVPYNPLFVLITTGSACNIECNFCYNYRRSYEPNPEHILRVLDKIHETLALATLSGGEPLITKAGRTLIEKFGERKYKFGVQLFTNAQYTDFNLLRPVNLTSVSISTDGATKKIYESVRVGANFETLITNIKKYVEFKNEKPYLDVYTNFTITSNNYMDIPEAYKLYSDLGLGVIFKLVICGKDDPQNIRERVDLYEPFLKKINETLDINPFDATKTSLFLLRDFILKKWHLNLTSN